jgi:hypothetical protein
MKDISKKSYLTVRITDELKAQIKDYAIQNSRTVSNQVVKILSDAVKTNKQK